MNKSLQNRKQDKPRDISAADISANKEGLMDQTTVMPTVMPIDFKQLKKLTNNNSDLANDLLNMFVAELPTIREQIKQSWSIKNYQQLESFVHRLHGSCCYCAANELKQLSKETEVLIHQKMYLAIENLILAIEQEIVSILHYLGQHRVA